MADNIVFQVNPMHLKVVVTDPAAPNSGDPVRFGGLTGIALLDEGDGGCASTETVVDFGWYVATHPVTDSGGGIAVGDEVFYDDATDALTDASAGNTPYGYALESVGAGLTATIRVLHCPGASLGAGTVGAAQIAANAVVTAKILNANVTKTKLAGGFAHDDIIAGVDETMVAEITVAGMAVGDELVSVIVWAAGVPTKRANADFTVAGGKLSVVANAANNAANKYEVVWNDLT